MSPRRACLGIIVLFAISVAAADDPSRGALPEGAVLRLGTLQFRHGTPVLFVAFTPDGQRVVSCAANGAVHLWEAATGKELKYLPGGLFAEEYLFRSPEFQRSFVLSPDGKILAGFATEGELWAADLGTASPTRKIVGYAQENDQVAMASDQKFWAMYDQQGEIQIHEQASKVIQKLSVVTAEERKQGNRPQLTAMAFSPDGTSLVTAEPPKRGGKDGNQEGSSFVRMWDLKSGQSRQLLYKVSFVPQRLTFSPDGRILLLRSQQHQLSLYDVATGKELRPPLERAASQLGGEAFSADSRLLAFSERGAIRIQEVASGKEVRRLEGGVWDTHALVFSPDGKLLAAGGDDHRVRLWNLTTGKEVHPSTGHSGDVLAATISPDGKVLATVGRDCTVCLWNAAGNVLQILGEPRQPEEFSNGEPEHAQIVFLPGETMLAAVLPNREVHRWETATGKSLGLLGPAGDQSANAAALSPDRSRVATLREDGTVQILELATGKEVHRFVGLKRPTSRDLGVPYEPTRLTFSPNGRLLLIEGMDAIQKAERRWEMRPVRRLVETATGKERQQLTLSVGSLTRMGGSSNTSEVNGQIITEHFDMLGQRDGELARTRFWPDGRTLSVGMGGTLILWDLVRGKELRRLGTDTFFFECHCSPDGRWLVLGLADGALTLWDTQTWTKLGPLSAHRGAIRAVTFSSDGKRMVTTAADTTALVWDLARLVERGRQAERGPSQSVDAFWNDLASADTERAGRAVWALSTRAKESVPLLSQRLRPAPPVDSQRIKQLIQDLDSKTFATRQKAVAELEKLGSLAEPFMRTAQAEKPSLEVGRRLEQILDKLRGPVTTPERLRELRAVEALELIGTPPACKILENLAGGAAEAMLTRDARAALDRLKQLGSRQ